MEFGSTSGLEETKIWSKVGHQASVLEQNIYQLRGAEKVAVKNSIPFKVNISFSFYNVATGDYIQRGCFFICSNSSNFRGCSAMCDWKLYLLPNVVSSQGRVATPIHNPFHKLYSAVKNGIQTSVISIKSKLALSKEQKIIRSAWREMGFSLKIHRRKPPANT